MRRRVMAISVALLTALFGVVGVIAYANAADRRAVAGQQTSTVWIATSEVPMGTTAAEAAAKKLIVQELVVAKGVPQGALTSAGATNRTLVATSAIMAGEIVLTSRFGALPSADATTAIPAGRVAVTVTLPDPQRAAPLLAPGSHIVLFDSYVARNPRASTLVPDGQHLGDSKENLRATRVLLPDVVVIAVGDTTTTRAPAAAADSKAGSQPDATAAALVTVAVTPSQAVTLVHAIQTGTLYAAVRGADVKFDLKTTVDDTTVLPR